ncbi:MAG: hypothetical protein RL268_13 [Pseudomonadota bacterium]|jgi:DNA-binding CsgD family transcriptional regulator
MSLNLSRSELHAELISAIGHPDFNLQLVQTFRNILNFDSAVLIAFFSNGDRPLCLAERSANEEFKKAHSLYLNTYFHRCELVDRLLQLRDDKGLAVIRQSSDNIIDSDYRRDLYDRPGISHDMIMLSQVDDLHLILEFFRSDQSDKFASEDEDKIREFWPVALACMRKNSRFLNLSQHNSSDRSLKIEFLTKMFVRIGTSKRESQICSHIALGYSTLAISMRLGISVNTVSTLRQRAYRKLGISCMNELYALCMSTITSSLAESDFDRSMLAELQQRAGTDDGVPATH